MILPSSILGKTAVDTLTKTASDAVLTVGSDVLTRADLARVGCYNFAAARNLSHALAESAITSLRDLFETLSPYDLARPHVGVISLAVLGAAFEAKKIGGASPLESYMKRHAEKVVTFDSVKTQVRKAHEQTKPKRKRRAA